MKSVNDGMISYKRRMLNTKVIGDCEINYKDNPCKAKVVYINNRETIMQFWRCGLIQIEISPRD